MGNERYFVEVDNEQNALHKSIERHAIMFT